MTKEKCDMWACGKCYDKEDMLEIKNSEVTKVPIKPDGRTGSYYLCPKCKFTVEAIWGFKSDTKN
jgi:hypothetical protein